jgi:proline dehydrogenase
MPEIRTTDARAATAALRSLALDEALKDRVAHSPDLRDAFRRISRRYVSGPERADAVSRAEQTVSAGHRVTVDFMGESARDRDVADAAAAEFVRLAADLAQLPGRSGLSLDASHVGSVIDGSLALGHLERLAGVTAHNDQELILSMEGEDRIDGILDLHRALVANHPHVGITVQARVDRTAGDLTALLDLPGRIRLVKGAYPTSAGVERDDPELAERFDALARRLIESGRPCSIASHDRDRIDAAVRHVQHSDSAGDVVFEFLQGIDDELLAETARRGVRTQEYIVYGSEEWLYVCNRIAEEPAARLLRAVTDLASS